MVGYNAMVLRDMLSFGLYFLFYDSLKTTIASWKNSKDAKKENNSTNTDSIGLIWRMISGGTSGVTAWGLCFPLDSLKIRI